MKYPLAAAILLLTFSSGCKVISAALNSDELVSDKHHSEPEVTVPRSVRTEGTIPDVKGEHPRLIFTDSEIPSVMEQIHRDPALSAKFDLLRQQGEKMLNEPPVDYIRDTERALTASRLVLTRITTLAGLYRLTGETRFADRARQEMLAAAAYPDWHPVDFLPTAELLNAEGLGYDWLYHYLSPEDRRTIYRAILNQGLVPAKHAYDNHEDWTYTTSNHNPVGNGGVAVAAVSIADEDPKLARELIADTRKSLPPAMSQYSPDGAWPEGPIYWDYATRYATFYLSALDSGLGTDFGASTYTGLAQTGMFRIQSTGPTRKTFNFGDAEELLHPTPFMYYLASRFHQPIYAAHEEYVSKSEANIFEVIWHARYGPVEPFERLAPGTLGLDAIFRGVDVAFFRSDWGGPDATWVGFKGGTNKGSHRHLDLGSFVMDADGVRWALDLGPDSYGLPGYNGSEKRWTYYRCMTQGHNTLTINNSNQETEGDSKMVAFHSGTDLSYAIVDLTAAYSNARRILRGVELLGRKDVAIIDEVSLNDASRITWNFHTKAEVELDGSDATLRLEGKTLHAEILAPAGAKFAIESANPPPPQTPQRDVHNLIVQLPERVSHTRIIVVLSPEKVSPEEGGGRVHRQEAERPKFAPLADWIRESPVKEVR